MIVDRFKIGQKNTETFLVEESQKGETYAVEINADNSTQVLDYLKENFKNRKISPVFQFKNEKTFSVTYSFGDLKGKVVQYE